MAGQAARVGTAALTVTDVQSRSQEVLDIAAAAEATEIDGAALNRAQVGTWVRGELSDLAAEREGITITDGEIDRFLDQVVAANGTTLEQLETAIALQDDFWISPSYLDEYVRSFLQQEAVAKALVPNGSDAERQAALITALTEVGDEAGVDVSPRYGEWDPATGVVGPPPNDLSTPAPSEVLATPGALLDVPSQG
jgi:hypothetical protein